MALQAGLILEDFSVYDVGAASQALLTSGVYVELVGQAGISPVVGTAPWDTDSAPALKVTPAGSTLVTKGARRPLDASYSDLMVRCRWGADALPPANAILGVLRLMDNAAVDVLSVVVNSTGSLSVLNGAGTVIGSTPGPVVTAGTYFYFEMWFRRDAADGKVTIRINDADGTSTPALQLSGLALGASNFAQYMCPMRRPSTSGVGEIYVKDFYLVPPTAPGTPNFLGDLEVTRLDVISDTDIQGWTPMPREMIGPGLLDTRATTSAAVVAGQSTDFDLGSGDFCLEMVVKFNVLPTGSAYAHIFGKWQVTSNQRSYQLIKCGPALNSGALIFRISTDGQAGTVTNIISWPWTPDTNTNYWLTIERVLGETTLYINGIAQGFAAVDANTYFAANAPFGICGEPQNVGGIVPVTGVNGFSDEIRVTVGAYRYDMDYTPLTVPFPRTLGGDPLLALVALLAGWDSSIADESLHGRTLAVRNGAVQETPDDAGGAFEDINNFPPRDDTFIQAEYRRASDELAFTANPAAAATITVGGKTYTIVVALTATPNQVLQGVDAETTINNLIAAINGGAGSGTVYSSTTLANANVYAEKFPGALLRASAIIAGVGGNAITATTSGVSGGWDTPTFTGGVDIPGPSEFYLGRLPFDATVVHAAQMVMRAYKTEAGATTIVPSFVAPLGAAQAGIGHNVTTSPTYYTDGFNRDPDTAGALTPATFVNARMRFNRTA